MSVQTEANKPARNVKTEKNNKPEKNNKHIWSAFFTLIKRSHLPYVWIAMSFILGIASSKLYLMVPDYTERVTSGDISSKTIIIFTGSLIMSAVVTILISLVSGITNARTTKAVSKSIWNEITTIPIHALEKENAKELISRITQDTTALSNLLAYSLPYIVSSLYFLVGSIIAVNNYHRSLMISLIMLIVLQLVVAYVIGKISFKYNNKVQLHLAKLTEHLSEVLANIPLVKVFVTEKKEDNRGKDSIGKYYGVTLKYRILNVFMMQSTSIVSTIGIITVIISGVVLVSKGTITIEQWVAYFMYYYNLQYYVQDLPTNWKEIKASQGIARRISEIACLEKEDYEKGEAVESDKRDISFKNIKFGYDQKMVLNGFSAEIPYGKTTALVGENGAGKSTILSLIERFYYPNEGKILYGDKDINQYKLKDWRKTFGYVSQDIKLMSGSIYENITYGLDKEVTKSQVEEACRKADALDFINSFKDGFYTQVGEFGNSLSGGQRQRICIARAILNNPRFLLLDEFTSNLDVESQENVQKALSELCKGRTTIVIAHKMSTVKNADNIVVIKDGQVNGVGRHEALMKSNKEYQNLVSMQALV